VRKNRILIAIAVISFMALTIITGGSVTSSGQQPSIPSWIKNTAKWWGEGQISDDEFIKALQWLIDQKILVVQSNNVTPATNIQKVVNPLAILLPSSDDIGPLWKIYDSTKSKIISSPRETGDIEQIFQKTAVTPPTIMTIDIVKFYNGNDAGAFYNGVLTDYKSKGGFQEWSFPTIEKTVCFGAIQSTGQQSSRIQLFCVRGDTVILAVATGNDIGMGADTQASMNIILNRIQVY